MAGTLYITGDTAADKLLNSNGNALLIGMLLDQQVPMEWAFAGPATLKKRLGHLDPKKIAADRHELLDVPRSVADIDGPASLGKVREWKQAQKAAKKDKQGRSAPA